MSVTLPVDEDMPKGCVRRNGRYSIRKVIPTDLQAHYGRREIVKALGTSEPKEARNRYSTELAKLELQFDLVRKQQSGISTVEIGIDSNINNDFDEIKFLQGIRNDRKNAREIGGSKEHTHFLREWIRYCTMAIDEMPEHPFTYDKLVKQRNAIKTELNGEKFIPIGAILPNNISVKANEYNRINCNELLDVFDKWTRDRKPKQRTIDRIKRLIDMLIEFSKVNNHGYLDKSLSIKFIDELTIRNMSNENINVCLGLISIIINYGIKRYKFNINPFEGLKLSERKFASEKRRPWTIRELNLLFNSRVYTEKYRPLAGGGEAAFWLPLLGLYTGARANELGQLHPEDIYEERYKDEGKEYSVWIIRLTKDAIIEQSLKNADSRRRFPIHQNLIDIGFIEYCQTAALNKQSKLFPDIKANANGELMGNWSKWFGRYRRSIGIKGGDPVFHSFRRNFEQYSRMPEIDKEIHNEFNGYDTGDISDNYGDYSSFSLRPIVRAVKKFHIPDLDLSNLIHHYRELN